MNIKELSLNDYIKLWNSFNLKRVRKSELKGDITFFNNAVNNGCLLRDINPPTICEEVGCDNPLKIVSENGTDMVLVDVENPRHVKRVAFNDITFYQLTDDFFRIFILKLLDLEFKIVGTTEYFDGYNILVNDLPITLLFLYNINDEKHLIYLLSKLSINNEPTILICNKFVGSEYLSEILKRFPFGYLCSPIFILEHDTMAKERLKSYLDINKKIKDIQRAVLDSIKDDQTKKLVLEITLNPQYLLGIITRLSLNKKRKTDEFDWNDFEKLTRILFTLIYHSITDVGGEQDLGKELGDAYFFVKTPTSIGRSIVTLNGVVDCKFSQHTNLSTEKTEKYVKYIGDLKSASEHDVKSVLLFIYLEEKTDHTTQEFIDRVATELAKNTSYVVLMDINALLIFAYFYLSLELNMIKISKKIDKDLLYKNILDDEFLKQNKFIRLTEKGNTYYVIDADSILKVLLEYVVRVDTMVLKTVLNTIQTA